MSEKPKILCVGDPSSVDDSVFAAFGQQYDIVVVEDLADAFSGLSADRFNAVFFSPQHNHAVVQLDHVFQNQRILDELPVGVALLDREKRFVWTNAVLRDWFASHEISGADFYSVFQVQPNEEIDFCPIGATLSNAHVNNATLHCLDNRYFKVHCIPFQLASGPSSQDIESIGDPQMHVVVTIRDVTNETLQQQKLTAIHKAGVELADLTAEEVFQMEVEQRIELLKSNILHYSKDVLNFDVVEIRLLHESGELMPLLSVGIEDEAASRPLFAQPEGYGVTGFVAATGKSYMCADTAHDPLYLEGCKGAKSSLTVPLMWHDQVIGTFNVETPEPQGFIDQDQQFLEIFSRDVANALNTLELLVAQQANTAQASVEAIHREVALPVDEILNDAVNVMEAYIGHDRSVVDRLRRILQNARDIKQLIHKVGQELAPAEAVPACVQIHDRPNLRGRRVLVVDADEDVRSAAHNLLDRFDCVVETAHEGGEAIFMVRNLDPGCSYDVIISEIRLPDMSGHDLLLKLKEIIDPVPLVLMTGFGYDPGHTIVKARQSGLLPNAILYKPFRLDQLLGVVEGIVQALGIQPQV